MATNPSTGWIPGFERIPTNAIPGTYLPGVPRRKVWHTTEFFSLNPRSIASRHANPPHFWVTLPSHPHAPGLALQLFSVDVSARALHHPSGTPETNKMGSIQTEVEGRAADMHLAPKSDLDWLAEKFAPVFDYCGINPGVFIQGNPSSAQSYGKRSKTRMSPTQWRAFNGMCSHQNVPDNEHWDAGGIDLAYLSSRMTAPKTPTDRPEPEEAAHMATRQIFQTGPNLSLMAEVSIAGFGIAAIRTQTEPNGMFSGWFPLHTDADPQPFGAVEVTAGTNADGRQEIVVYSKLGHCARKVRNSEGGWKPWTVEG